MGNRIAVLIPCYNEESTIEIVIQDFQKHLPEASIYVCNNNSSDLTGVVAETLGVKVLFEAKQGKGYAVSRLFNSIEADFYVLVDGDDTYPAESARQMISILEKSNANMVVGDRLSNCSYKYQNKRKFHNFGNSLMNRLINTFFKSNIKDILSGYRVFDRAFVQNYASFAKGFEIETDLTLFALNYDLEVKEVPIDYRDRPEGSFSKLNTYSDGIRVIFTFFNLYRLYKPLSFFSIIALFLLVIGCVLGSFPVYEYIQFRFVYKVPTAILALGLVIMAALLFCCGLILDLITNIDRKNMKLKMKKYAFKF
ncbi:glycosyltransferase family 2 protein [Flavobacterium sp. HSC-61S13]|uniref:glycosyltransferase family 2 protein n=1 Tax=Flavobacterium sp. HSC-61S13 TaxID=2910963 RepID=UPI00209CC9C6|nr:glycosyltransferase family 2 protein [Flavobacterium sp. HSC-61S13]MCP1997197.1 glycosyltransferase involved in cell wall biosynthesis [Flavobacterium sp. HSC-61S13]